jgi:hypothetical protein
MRLSELWQLADAVFGPAYSRTLAREIALTSLGSRTPMAALEDGVAPRDVWHAWCDEMEIPPSERDGRDRNRLVPPAR